MQSIISTFSSGIKFPDDNFEMDEDELHAHWINKVDKSEVS